MSSKTPSPVIKTTPSNFFDYIFMYSYPVTFIGALFFSVASLFDKTIHDYVADKKLNIFLCVFIAISSFISLIYWFNDSDLSIVNNIANSTSSIYNFNTVKARSNSN